MVDRDDCQGVHEAAWSWSSGRDWRGSVCPQEAGNEAAEPPRGDVVSLSSAVEEDFTGKPQDSVLTGYGAAGRSVSYR